MGTLIKKINYIFDKKRKVQSVFLCIGLFAGALFELVGVSLITGLVSLIGTPSKIHESAVMQKVYDLFHMTSDRQFFLAVVIGLIVFYLIKNVFLLGINYLLYSFIYNNQLRLSGKLVDCYLKKPYTYHLNTNSGDMIRNIMLDSERFFQMILCIFQVLAETLIATLLSVYLLIVDPFITISVVLVLGIFSLLYVVVFKGQAKKYGKINQYYDGKMHQAILQALGAVKDIKILKREKYFSDVYVGYGKKKLDAVRDNNVLGQLPKYLIETICIGAVIVLLIFKVGSSGVNSMLPQLAAFAVATFKLLPSVSKINNFINLIIFLKPSVDLIYQDIKETEDMIETGKEDAYFAIGKEMSENKRSDIYGKETVSDDIDESGIHDPGEITVSNLYYRYPNTDKDVLENVNISIPLGKSVGLVGPSGSGKSTLADIILGILSPTEGNVFCNGMDVHKNPEAWAKRLAYIPQAIYLADETVRSNIAFGIEEEKIDDEKVLRALKEAKLDGFIDSLDDGINSMIGERGVRISGGQRQRIGIARALYDNPEILVLDEATSALDNNTESEVMEEIDALSGRKTLIIIAHRLSTLRNCDLIYKVENGSVTLADKEEILKGTK